LVELFFPVWIYYSHCRCQDVQVCQEVSKLSEIPEEIDVSVNDRFPESNEVHAYEEFPELNDILADEKAHTEESFSVWAGDLVCERR